MFLKRLYSEPLGLFRSGKPEHPDTIVFKNGFNFIFGKKEQDTNEKDSINGVGKSTLCDLIDFCLLADFNSRNARLYKEQKRLEDYTIVLEFESDSVEYILKRKPKDDKKVQFGHFGHEISLSLKDARAKLFEVIFDNPDYVGVLKLSWYRSMISFFLKIHKKQKTDFADPIKFLTANNTATEVNQYHFFLLGLDNALFSENYDFQQENKDISKAINQVKRIVEKNYNVNIKDVNIQLNKLKNETKKSKQAVDAFQLAEQHKNVEVKLNELTKKIKFLAEQNFWLTKKVQSYQESYELKDTISSNKIRNIEKLYTELNQHLEGVIQKSLKEAVKFRKQLSESREEFLREEIESLGIEIRKNELQIRELDEERQKLFVFLKSKAAFEDLTEAFHVLNEKERQVAELESKIKTLRDLQKQKVDYEKDNAEMTQKAITFLEKNQDQIERFERLFTEVYQNIYTGDQTSGFSITPNYGTGGNKADINIAFDKDESKGWNKGRTLVYDIAVMVNAIQHQINMPCFLLHDGIFDGMDKAHFVALYHYVQGLQQKGFKFQYIVTMMEEGELQGNFGDTDNLSIERIVQSSIALLTYKEPLWVD